MDYLLNAYDYFRPGGMIMLLLVATSLWMWVLIFERLVYYWQVDRQDVGLAEAVRLVEARQAVKPTEGVCQRMVAGFLAARTQSSPLNQRILDQMAMRQGHPLRRCLPTITVLAATAPLLGLLGTVTGMVGTFDVIALFGTGNAKALSGGISKALVTTQCGLLVGIPGLFMSRLLSRRAHAIERRLGETLIVLKRTV